MGAGITDLVTVFMKVMVKRRMRGSTRSQSERSTFTKCVKDSTDSHLQGRHCHPESVSRGWMEIDNWQRVTTGSNLR